MTYLPFDLLALEELPTYVPSRTTRARHRRHANSPTRQRKPRAAL